MAAKQIGVPRWLAVATGVLTLLGGGAALGYISLPATKVEVQAAVQKAEAAQACCSESMQRIEAKMDRILDNLE